MDSTRADPKRVHAAWMLLSPDQRAALIKAQPARFGNLNGIPAADRDVANQATLNGQLAQLAAVLKAMGLDPTMNPNHLDGLSQGQIRALGWAGLTPQQARQALLLKAQLELNGENGAMLLAYEPEVYGGKGRAAIAFGDVDHADNVAVCVPGLNSGLHNVDQVTSDALSLYKQSYSADLSRHTAVVAWQGYDAPGYDDVAFRAQPRRAPSCSRPTCTRCAPPMTARSAR